MKKIAVLLVKVKEEDGPANMSGVEFQSDPPASLPKPQIPPVPTTGLQAQAGEPEAPAEHSSNSFLQNNLR